MSREQGWRQQKGRPYGRPEIELIASRIETDYGKLMELIPGEPVVPDVVSPLLRN